ncbi:MAG TPA: CaiB/BaiF CoA-transferase family protein [Caulobacterales bacterium]|jgi:crotonobetainyl-CoA:carnitine CoA-transferase CaiB-like acyl-CoA transferase|nr:CaiB/BaiF CoA-transferase family protein [Caulobacterales bacterium]
MLLKGLKVIELATYIAAPGAGAIMADWGADVIKIESPAGDPMRDYLGAQNPPDFDPVFAVDNRGKRAIVVDTRHEEGRAVVRKLLAGADVLITNLRPSQLKKSGFDYETLKGDFPRLVHATITGYGLQGPEADRAAMDMAAFWARSGVTHMLTARDAEPLLPRLGMGDHITAVSIVAGVMAALYERGQTGRGRQVEASLYRSAFYAVSSDMAIHAELGRVASTRPRRRAVNPLANYFKTADGHWVMALTKRAAEEWDAFCEVMARPDLLGDERFATRAARAKNQDALIDALDEGFAKRTLAEVAAIFDAHDMVWAPVQTPGEALADRVTADTGAMADLKLANGRVAKTPGAPLRFPGTDDGPKSPPPGLGADTYEVLAEIGYSKPEIDALTAKGAVKQG